MHNETLCTIYEAEILVSYMNSLIPFEVLNSLCITFVMQVYGFTGSLWAVKWRLLKTAKIME